MDLEQMLRFENEYTQLDFKRTQYRKEQYANLIKDIIAMANADANGPRHIIVGIKHHPAGDREYHPINHEDFVDEAIYQQLIRENIEPEITFRYIPLRLEEGLFGVFVIDEPLDPPYLLKKDRDTLKAGDGWIRIGSAQRRLSRSDLDSMYSQKLNSPSYAGGYTLTKSVFEQELSWAAGANSNGSYFSVIVDYGRDFGELTSNKRRDILEWAAKATDQLGLESNDTYKNSTTEVVEYWTPSGESDFHVKYRHPGVFWIQFRNKEQCVPLDWLIEKYTRVYNLLKQLPSLRNIEERRLGIAFVNWPQFGIDLNPHVKDYLSLQNGHLRGASMVEQTSLSDESNWEQFFKITLEKCLTERGYIGHENDIRALEIIF